MQKVKLDCESCGAPLQDVDRAGYFKRPYCGRSYIFKEDLRTGGEQRKKRSLKAKTNHPPEIPVDRRTSPVSEELIEKVKALLANKMKIHSIKLFRDETGAGLKEAKDFVESLEERMM
ncbi:MAG: ribosomal protein L7/L12 [Anaerolineales bacterium]|nr:ribosomal protein L7/L12 [Anaerolineales bacterium]